MLNPGMKANLQIDDMAQFFLKMEVPEEIIQIFQEFRAAVDARKLHPNSSEYRWLERDCLLRMGVAWGRLNPQ